MEESQVYRQPISTTGRPLSNLLNRIRVGCNHMSVIYLNRDFTIVFLAFIGLLLGDAQYNTIYFSSNYVLHDKNLWYTIFIFVITSTSCGILSYVYPPQKMMAISIIVPSVIYLVNAFSIGLSDHILTMPLKSVVFFMSLAAFHGIWAQWVQLNKLSVYHGPIVLYMAYESHFMSVSLAGIGTFEFGVFGLIWGAIWMYINRIRPDDTSYYSMFSFSIQPKLSDIPWKSISTSMPFVAIILAYVCEAFNYIFFHDVLMLSESWKRSSQYSTSMNIAHSTSMLSILFGIFLIEFFPEVNIFSTIAVRKFWSCAYFSSRAVLFLIYSHYSELLIHDLFLIVYGVIGVFYCFGYVVNHMDLSPRHASILISIITAVRFSSYEFIDAFVNSKYHENNRVDHLLGIQIVMVLLNLIGCVFYYVFASTDLQPWANTQIESEQESDITGVPST